MKLKQFAFIIINTIYFNTFYDHLIYYQNTLPTPTPNAEFTRRLYVAFTRRAHNAANRALEDPTALPQRANTLYKRQAAAFVLNMLKINAAA